MSLKSIFSHSNEYIQFLSKCHINQTYGFLSFFDNLKVPLPHKFNHSHSLACNISDLLRSKTLAKEINNMTISQDDVLQIRDEQIAAKIYSIYAYLTNAYIHTVEANERHIPQQLWEPYHIASKMLGMREIYTFWAPVHAFTIIDPEKPYSHDNIKVLYSFTNTETEENFFKANLLSTHSHRILIDMCFALNHICYKHYDEKESKINFNEFSAEEIEVCRLNLDKLANAIRKSVQEMKKTFRNMDPNVFFDNVRLYLKGYSEYKDVGLAIKSSPSSKLDYSGASSGQDPSIFLLKIVLGINYPANMKNYENELMKGFRKPHQDFVKCIKEVSLIHKLKEFEETKENFEKCLLNLKEYYKIHKALVVQFIEKPGMEKNYDVAEMKGVGDTPLSIIKEIKNFT